MFAERGPRLANLGIDITEVQVVGPARVGEPASGGASHEFRLR
jgi:hypothetical protein